ncbi:MAG TPA: fasciclin domain-containing protein [Pseudonocardia sp.]|uniref:fasciclin domain-containing protein n=1 Tax=Pseudonocardia sp. TaxID=60912 RepID=UPI002BA687FA|nr:fasciclin domain-containing protein [Pseudonocardia sp.]HTF53988.1 fasciclin domain-containing protein [Pseudonocardia sp.]
MRIKRIVLALSITAAAGGLSACGTSVPSPAPTSAAAEAAPAAQAVPQFGSACSAVPTSGPGSFSGMATDPVATAASHNPVLSTLVTAVKKANLVDTLNSAQNITVFAPANAAFDKIPPATLNKVLADNATLTKILTYHVVGQKITPAELASGDFKTLEGASLKTSGSGQDFTINGVSRVICGNVQTANATVYIIDSVLMPPAKTPAS